MNITLPDGSQLSVPAEATALTVAETIGSRLGKAAVAAKIGDRLVDLATPVREGDRVSIVTLDSEEGLEVLRHSTAHVLAEAVTRVRPGTKVAIGPAIKDGFYYDFEFQQPISEEDLASTQKRCSDKVSAFHLFKEA